MFSAVVLRRGAIKWASFIQQQQQHFTKGELYESRSHLQMIMHLTFSRVERQSQRLQTINGISLKKSFPAAHLRRPPKLPTG